MATAGIYYIDTFNFADATAVYADEALTTFAPDGFYQMGGVSAREQVSGVLRPAELCPTCGTTPTPDPTPVPNNAYTVTDTVTGNTDHVIKDTRFPVQRDVTININTNCWLITGETVNATTNRIFGFCSRPPTSESLYYQLELCGSSSNTAAETSIYVDQDQAPSDALGNLYENTVTNAFYFYNNTVPVTTPLPNISIVTTLAQQVGACPPVPTVFTYWNASECTTPTNTIVIQAPADATFVQGTSSVKINGSDTCYLITTQRTGTEITFDGVYAGTTFTACNTGTNPCIPTGPVFVSFQAIPIETGTTLLVKNNGGTSGDIVKINGFTGCYRLGDQTTTPTTLTIETNPCPAEITCVVFGGQAGILGGTLTYRDCIAGSNVTRVLASNEEFGGICGRVGTININNNGTLDITTQSCNRNNIPVDDGFDYYVVEPCAGGAQINVRRTTSNTLVSNSAIKIAGNTVTCYKIIDSIEETTPVFDISDTFDSCVECEPPSCFGISVNYQAGTNTCPTSGSATVFSATGVLETSETLHATESDCLSGIAAPVGTYAETFTNAGGDLVKISRYWNGATLSAPQTCSLVTEVTATLSTITNNIEGTILGVGYFLGGSTIGTEVTGPSPLTVIGAPPLGFDTDITVNRGFTLVSKTITYTPSTNITSDQSVNVTIDAVITQDPSVFSYSVISCGNNQFYRVSSSQAVAVNQVIRFKINNSSQILCGTVSGDSAGISQGTFFELITSRGCNNNSCAANVPDEV